MQMDLTPSLISIVSCMLILFSTLLSLASFRHCGFFLKNDPSERSGRDIFPLSRLDSLNLSFTRRRRSLFWVLRRLSRLHFLLLQPSLIR